MVKSSKRQYVVHRYPKAHYLTLFDRRTGFFARIEEQGYAEPFWSPVGPELLDISITNWCDKGCSTCYKNSSVAGQHMSLEEYETIMIQAQEMDVLQVALGGGNPNQHPDFIEVLRLSREQYGIVPSYTTNGFGLTEEILEASAKYCGAVAVSAYKPYEVMRDAIELLLKHNIRVNIHLVLSAATAGEAIAWLSTPLSILKKVNAIVFLSYKPVGRNKDCGLLLNKSPLHRKFFELALGRTYPFKVGFDSCLVSGVVTYGSVPSMCHDFCDAGRFSMYISENMKMYPCSFMIEKVHGVPVTGVNMLETWRDSKIFADMRKRHPAERCAACPQYEKCQTGCPAFPEINVCR